MLVCAARLPHAPATPFCHAHWPALEIDSAEPPEAQDGNAGAAASTFSTARHTSLDVESPSSDRSVCSVYSACLAAQRACFPSPTLSSVLSRGCYTSDSQCSCRRHPDPPGSGLTFLQFESWIPFDAWRSVIACELVSRVAAWWSLPSSSTSTSKIKSVGLRARRSHRPA